MSLIQNAPARFLSAQESERLEEARFEGFVIDRYSRGDGALSLEYWTLCVQESRPFIRLDVGGRHAHLTVDSRPVRRDLPKAVVETLEGIQRSYACAGENTSIIYGDRHMVLCGLPKSSGEHIARQIAFELRGFRS